MHDTSRFETPLEDAAMPNQSGKGESTHEPKKKPYQSPRIVSLGDSRRIVKSDTSGPLLDGDSDSKYRNKP